MKHCLSFFLYLSLLSLTMFSQIDPLQAQVGPNLGTTSRLMNQARTAMEEKNYERANDHFRQIIDSNVPIPPEMPYFFAETLYHLGQFSNSSNFLQKYLDLNGFNGEHYNQAKELQKKLEKPLNDIRDCSLCDRLGYRLTTCTTCEGNREIPQACGLCKESGIVGCSRCAGRGVVTKRNVFNIVEYYDCERCEASGRITCPRCEGEKTEYGACNTCRGQGTLPTEEICDHENRGLTHIQTSKTIFNIFESHVH